MTTEMEAASKLRLREFLAGIDLFTRIEPNMPIQMLRAYVISALHEGEMVNSVADEAGLPGNIMSRHLGDWGQYDRQGNDSHYFIETRTDVRDRRRRRVWLTVKGKRFLEQLLRTLRAA